MSLLPQTSYQLLVLYLTNISTFLLLLDNVTLPWFFGVFLFFFLCSTSIFSSKLATPRQLGRTPLVGVGKPLEGLGTIICHSCCLWDFCLCNDDNFPPYCWNRFSLPLSSRSLPISDSLANQIATIILTLYLAHNHWNLPILCHSCCLWDFCLCNDDDFPPSCCNRCSLLLSSRSLCELDLRLFPCFFGYELSKLC